MIQKRRNTRYGLSPVTNQPRSLRPRQWSTRKLRVGE